MGQGVGWLGWWVDEMIARQQRIAYMHTCIDRRKMDGSARQAG